MPQAIGASTESRDVSGLTLCQTSDYSVRLIPGILPACILLCALREPQLRLYRKEGQYPKADPALRINPVRDNPDWRSRGRSRTQRADGFCCHTRNELGACVDTSWEPRSWRDKVGEVTRPSAYALTDYHSCYLYYHLTQLLFLPYSLLSTSFTLLVLSFMNVL